MAAFDPAETRRKAVRDFLIFTFALFTLPGIPLYFYAASPVVPEPLRYGTLGAMAMAWALASAGLIRHLHRDLTPVGLLEGGLRAGRKFVPYAEIAHVDSQPGLRVFGLRMRNRRFNLYLSKIGIASEEAFFEELRRKIAAAIDEGRFRRKQEVG